MIFLPLLDFHAWAPRPPMGWNSWDCFGTTVTQAQTLAEADVMVRDLKRFGWRLITVDIQWYEPNSRGYNYKPGATLAMDANGRLLPATNKFPGGFRRMGLELHRRGLQFGIHLMRGIPRQAVQSNATVLGTPYSAKDIADTRDVCPWNSDMYGVDMAKPGAQAYYDSVFKLIASWGVDFVKVDDLSRPYHRAEIEAIRKAIDRSGRKIIFSTSPGETPLSAGPHIRENANMWRISDDFWDDWNALEEQFARLNAWTPYREDGAYPDSDMLPLGVIGLGRRSHFTPDEGRTLITLWCIARSPLIFGGDLTKLDGATNALITNPEVLAVDQQSRNNRQLFRTSDGKVAWIADAPGSNFRYLAVFNLSSTAQPVEVNLSDVVSGHAWRIRDLWSGRYVSSTGAFAPVVPGHGSELFRVSRRWSGVSATASSGSETR